MSYNLFSWYYDSLMDPSFYQDYAILISKYGPFCKVLELGCGTGTLSRALTNQIETYEGWDLSKTMIEICLQNQNFPRFHYLEKDMQLLEANDAYDGIICACDSLNYLEGKQAQAKQIERMIKALKKDGYLIFDVHTLHKLNVTLKDYIEEQEDEDSYFYWHAFKKDDYTLAHSVIIEDLDSDERLEEKHFQFIYQQSFYLDVLKQYPCRIVDIVQDDEDRDIYIIQKG